MHEVGNRGLIGAHGREVPCNDSEVVSVLCVVHRYILTPTPDTIGPESHHVDNFLKNLSLVTYSTFRHRKSTKSVDLGLSQNGGSSS